MVLCGELTRVISRVDWFVFHDGQIILLRFCFCMPRSLQYPSEESVRQMWLDRYLSSFFVALSRQRQKDDRGLASRSGVIPDRYGRTGLPVPVFTVCFFALSGIS
jgi:hypothetical protein